MNLKMAFQMICFIVLLVWTNGVFGKNIFNIKNFGATPDGKTDSSKALLDAWSKACEGIAGNTVLIPSGTFLVNSADFKGPCNGHIVFKIDGVLKASDDPSLGTDYWISFRDIKGLTVYGNGSFDGQGAKAWQQNKCANEEDCKPPPVSLKFSSVTNGSIYGITSINSKFFHFHICQGDNIHVQHINISAPGNSQNTDGIHVSNSNNIKISHSTIATGDDCVSLGPGNTNIEIAGIKCGPGHGISIGSLGKNPGEGEVSGIIVRNCSFKDTQNGVRIKTWALSNHGKVFNVTFKHIVMDNTDNPIIIDQQYCPYTSCSSKADSQVGISDVKYINIKGSSRSKVALDLDCSKSVPCQDIEFSGMDIKYSGQGGQTTSSCSNVKASFVGQKFPPPCS